MLTYELRYQPEGHRARYFTVAGKSVADALAAGRDTLREIGLGNAAGLSIRDIEIEDLNWEPRYQMDYSGGAGKAVLDSRGEPVVTNDALPRFAVHLRYTGAVNALGKTGEEKITTLYGREVETPGRGRPGIGGAAHIRFGEDLLAEVDKYATAQGHDRAAAVRSLVATALTSARPLPEGALDEAGTDVLHADLVEAVRQLPEDHRVRVLWERLDEILTAGGGECLPGPWDHLPCGHPVGMAAECTSCEVPPTVE
ncbi:hypothetical protein ACFV1L_21900 [Kitasatospora sp. NPDC059646]|uniref:hypothetical protein n=1 Tax=Kitasatospora sp. NPDC059646 TaxID=3346893 RepID=UPI0036874A2E